MSNDKRTRGGCILAKEEVEGALRDKRLDTTVAALASTCKIDRKTARKILVDEKPVDLETVKQVATKLSVQPAIHLARTFVGPKHVQESWKVSLGYEGTEREEEQPNGGAGRGGEGQNQSSCDPKAAATSRTEEPNGNCNPNVFDRTSHEDIEQGGPEFGYSNLFQIASLRLPYVVLIGGWEKGANEFRRGEIECLKDEEARFQLPKDFLGKRELYVTREGVEGEPKCRLAGYDCMIVPGDRPNRLTFRFSRITYLDYLMSGEHLDDPLPDDPRQTFRDKYAARVDREDLTHWELPNICGVGVFVLTRDDRIIISRHSTSVQVYGGVSSYSASGTMDWDSSIDPFDEVARECKEEIGLKMSLANTNLVAFGIDSKKLYFQFSFLTRTGASSREIIAKAPGARDYHAEMENIEAVPFKLDVLVDLIKNHKWEPAAAATLLTICAKEFGLSAVEEAIDPHYTKKENREEMQAEWDHRASRPDELADMSARYPRSRCPEESRKYVDAVMGFLGDAVKGKDVVEIGAGTGRITERLVKQAGQVTCLDISPKMLDRNRKRLGPFAARVNYVQTFGQDYHPKTRHDVVICSLVLIHNVGEYEFQELCHRMSTWADTIFLFEHTDVGAQVSWQTELRGSAHLLSAFSGFEEERTDEYHLFNDRITFLKLVRSRME